MSVSSDSSTMQWLNGAVIVDDSKQDSFALGQKDVVIGGTCGTVHSSIEPSINHNGSAAATDDPNVFASSHPDNTLESETVVKKLARLSVVGDLSKGSARETSIPQSRDQPLHSIELAQLPTEVMDGSNVDGALEENTDSACVFSFDRGDEAFSSAYSVGLQFDHQSEIMNFSSILQGIKNTIAASDTLFDSDTIIKYFGDLNTRLWMTDEEDDDMNELVYTVTMAMTSFPNQTSVLSCACATLSQIPIPMDGTNSISRPALENGVKAVISAMRNSSTEEVQGNGAKALGNFALVSPCGRSVVATRDGIELIVAAMKRFASSKIRASSEIVQRHGCLALGQLASDSASNQRRIIIAGGIDVVVHAMMKDHPWDEEIQVYGCRMLAEVTHELPTKDRQLKRGLAQLALKGAMTRFPDNDLIQGSWMKATGALRDGRGDCTLNPIVIEGFGYGERGEFRPASINRISDDTTDKLSLPSHLDSCRYSREVQDTNDESDENSDGTTITSIASHSSIGSTSFLVGSAVENTFENSSMDKRTGTIRPNSDAVGVLSAMEINVDDEELQISCLKELKRLSTRTLGGVSLCSRYEDIPRAVVHSMQRHGCNDAIQELGCSVLAELASEWEPRGSIAASNGVTAVVDVMGLHTSNAQVQKDGCRVIGNLAYTHGELIGACNGVQVVVAAMKEHLGHREIQELGCWALYKLAHEDVNRASIQAANGIEAVVAAMRGHRQDIAIQEKGCLALEHLARADSTFRRKIRDVGGVDVLQKAKATFVHFPWAIAALRVLQRNV